jgi:hypothetical protein
VVIGKSNGAGVNKTEFNLKSLNIGMDRRIAQGIRPSIPTLNLTTGDGDNIAQPVGTEHTIDKAVGLAIGKTNLNAIHKTMMARRLKKSLL